MDDAGGGEIGRLRLALDEEEQRHPDFYEGVAATHRLFTRALREAGAEAVESVGRAFDPQVYEAVATVPSSGVESGTLAREVRRGWRVGNELLRAAQVVVAMDPEPAEPWR